MKPLIPAFLVMLACAPAAAQSLEESFSELHANLRPLAAQAGAAPRPAAGGPVGADLRAQTGYPQGAPDQGSIGSCHEFAAAALLNSAYFRRYGRSVRFSPADLFIQTVLLTGQLSGGAIGRAGAPQEGGNSQNDLNLALENGVAEEGDLPYDRFAREYFARILPSNAREARRADANGQLTRLANMEELARLRSEQGDEDAYVPFAQEIVRATSAQVERLRALVRRRFRARWPAIEEARQRAKAEFAAGGFVTDSVQFPRAYPASQLPHPEGVAAGVELEGWDMKRENCRSAGRPQRDYILEQLGAGRPVAVSFDLQRFEEWGQGEFVEGEGEHEFLIVGYAAGPGGLSFSTLNSWGPEGNRPVPETALCRIFTATILRTASDRP